jgi:sigma-E factor negative regulatory protein RseB
VEQLASQWEPKWLPPGFVLSSYQVQDDEESWMYTDGLAVFSVFIDSAERSRNLPPVDAKLGTTVAVLTKAQFNNQHYAICVVGEIPRATAQQIANAISPVILTPQAQQQGH